MADPFFASCAVLLQNPGADKPTYLGTVSGRAPRTGSLGDAFLPAVFETTFVSTGLPSADQEDYMFQFCWLCDRQVVDVKKRAKDQRRYIEDNFCKDLSYVDDAVLLSLLSPYNIIEENPNNLIAILKPLPSAFSRNRALSPVLHDITKHRIKASCAVLLADPQSEQLKYLGTVSGYAPHTSSLADAFLPDIFETPSVVARLRSIDREDYAYDFYWLPQLRPVVDVLKTAREQRKAIERDFCTRPHFTEGAIPLSKSKLLKTIEQKPHNLIVILVPHRSPSSKSRPRSPVPAVHDVMKYLLEASCAVLLRDPRQGDLMYLSTVSLDAPCTSTLGDTFLPDIFTSSVFASLPSADREDYAFEFYWLPERQVVDVSEIAIARRIYIEDNFCNDPSFIGDAVRLTLLSPLKTIEEKPHNLIVILVPLPSVFSRSRALKHGLDRERIAKTACWRKSPSTEARLSQLRATQSRDVVDAIYNGRPFELLGVPITIYSSAFTHFLRVMEDDNLEFSPEELKYLREYVRVSVAHHMDEATRVKRMAGLMHVIMGHSILDVIEIQLSSGVLKPDGVVKARVEDFIEMARTLRCIVEVKNEIGEGGCDPIAQAERCYKVYYSSEQLQRLRATCCCPCLLIGIAGPRIIVSGAVFAETLLIQELSDYRSSVPRPTLSKRSMFDQQIYETGRLFRAIKTAIDDLGAFYQSLKLPPVPPHRSRLAAFLAPPKAYIGPQFTRFEADGQAVTLTYTGRLSDEYPFQAVFTAVARKEGSDVGHDVVVKFTHNYCEEGHKLLADHRTPGGAPRPLAPRLWHCSENADVGMYVVVMDWIMDTEERTMTEEDHATLREAIALLHGRNLVFGDLREPNVLLIKGGGLMLIDFDWCGREGTARYPRDMNEDGSIPWAEDAQAGQLIKKQHDLQMLVVLASED
ncbi:hypothetical protein FKP32DRAFT_1586656 [Trametes sanguinea]|nr:hypothetical protein FKP32DRAFT_1586656 [Trametes sanguinea]